MGDPRQEQHQHARERPGAEARNDRPEQRQRRHCDREDAGQLKVIGVRDQRGDRARVDSAANRAGQIVHGRLQRPSEVHLREDDGRQHRPQRQGKMQPERQCESQEGGDRHPDREAQLHPVLQDLRPEPSPSGCGAAHRRLPECLNRGHDGASEAIEVTRPNDACREDYPAMAGCVSRLRSRSCRTSSSAKPAQSSGPIAVT